MSNISQASKNIKKKMSFDDYGEPAGQKDSVPAHQQASAPVGQQDLVTAVLQDGEAYAPSSQRAGKQAGQRASKMAKQPAGIAKTKATFYLSEEDNQALTDMFIKRLQEKNKTDKSALISEAIGLLYKREMK